MESNTIGAFRPILERVGRRIVEMIIDPEPRVAETSIESVDI